MKIKNRKKIQKIIDRFYDDIQHAAGGLSFKEEVELEKEKNRIISKMVELNPSIKKDISNLNQLISKLESKNHSLEKKLASTIKKNGTTLNTFLNPTLDIKENISGMCHMQAHPPPSCFFMIPDRSLPVHNGILGYDTNRPEIVNRGNGIRAQATGYFWQATIPEDGTYSFYSDTGPVYIKTRYSLTGSSFFGVDAKIRISYLDHIGLDDGRVFGGAYKVINDQKSAFGTTRRRADFEVKSDFHFLFKAKAGQVISRLMQKNIWTWTNLGGTVRATSEMFGITSNFDGDRVFKVCP